MTQASAREQEPLREKTWLAWILLAIIVACQLVRITSTFEAREGFHSDESWSYGFANSTDGGYIFRKMLGEDESLQHWDADPTIINFDEWESSASLHNYLTVQPDERFDYSAVLYNARYDLSPPLQDLILHTICSFFPDSFSWWYAYSINFVAFIFAQLFLFLVGRRLFHSPWLALLPPGFYGFTTGALNCFVYLRPYALLVCLVTAFCYINIRLRDADYQQCPHLYALLFLVTFLGAYTNIYFLIFAFFMTLGFCIVLLVRRRFKSFLVYGLSTLAGVLCMLVASWPAISALLFTSQGNGGSLTDPLWRSMYCLSTLLLETTGVGITSHYLEAGVCIAFGFLVVVIVLAAFCFVFRNESWFKAAWGHVKGFFVRVGRKFRRTAHEPRNGFWYFLILFVTTACVITIVGMSVNVSLMRTLVDRYLFACMAPFCLLAVWFFWQILARLIRRPKVWCSVLVALCVVLVIGNNLNSSCNYLFKRNADFDGTIETLVQDNDVVLVSSQPWQLTYWSSRLQYSREYFALSSFDSENHTETLDALDDGRPVYLVLDTMLFPDENGILGNGLNVNQKALDLTIASTGFTKREYLEYLSRLSWVDQTTYIGKEQCFVGTVEVYRLR